MVRCLLVMVLSTMLDLLFTEVGDTFTEIILRYTLPMKRLPHYCTRDNRIEIRDLDSAYL